MKKRQWTILLEATDDHAPSAVGPDQVRLLVASWSDPAPAGLSSPGRYALQIPVEAVDAASALTAALSLWRDALERAGLPEWELVRAEILTLEEFDDELEAAARADDPTAVPRVSSPEGDGPAAEELLRQAFHDVVTGLPNREMFVDEVRHALSTPVVGDGVRAVVTVAVGPADGTAEVGAPQPPDDLIVEIARNLTATVRADDTVARTGPAAFAAFVTLACPAHADLLAERVVRSACSAGDRRGRPLAATVGVATASAPDDGDDLVAMAEMAMAAADPDGQFHALR